MSVRPPVLLACAMEVDTLLLAPRFLSLLCSWPLLALTGFMCLNTFAPGFRDGENATIFLVWVRSGGDCPCLRAEELAPSLCYIRSSFLVLG